jgi:DNA integrity scanning protein DisA with diadenylate cyclase activity
MSKFFIQMLLSLVVAVSAAVGFRPEVKGTVSKTLREAKAFTQEIAGSIFQASNVEVEAEASVSTEASAEALLKHQAEGELESETNANVELDNALNGLSETNVGILFSAESEGETEIKSNQANLNLENEIESQLDVEAGIGN